MKKYVAALILILLFMHVRTACAASVGEIVTVSGNISSINHGSKTVYISGTTYVVTNNSSLLVNGKPGTISDLRNGMKVSGSAEIAASDSILHERHLVIRRVTATTDPTYVPPREVAPPPLTPSQDPFGTRRPAQEEIDKLTQKLSGTFWAIPDFGNPNGEKPWISLNPDGTTTSSRSEKTGTWRVSGRAAAQIVYFRGATQTTAAVVFDDALSSGVDYMLRPLPLGVNGRPNGQPAAWTRIESPTQEMEGKVPEAQAQASIPNQASPLAQEAASDIVKANHNNLVFVTGKDGAGSGFIASMGGTNFLITNAHVAAGINNAAFKTLDGTVVNGVAGEVAVGHDIFRIALPAGGRPLDIMTGVEENAGIGDEVVVLGNAEGSGVINTLMGKIVGIGPNLVEIDSQFVPGNSGSPIIHLKSGKVIGVATYTVTRKYDPTTKQKMQVPVIRRFGYRLDSVKTWQSVNWQNFRAQAAQMEAIESLTASLGNFLSDLAKYHGHVTAGAYSNPAIKLRIDQWLDAKRKHMSAQDEAFVDSNFISFLQTVCHTDVVAAQQRLTYDYFQRELADQQKERGEISDVFDKIIKDIKADR